MSSLKHHHRAPRVCLRPAFLTGTSNEYVGERPLPRVVRDRPVVFVLGPVGVGKSLVAERLAVGSTTVLDTVQVQAAILHRVRNGAWAMSVLEPATLVLDGPVWLHNRPGVVDLLQELIEMRVGRTIVCQADPHASVDLLMQALPAGTSATIALRFPCSRRARLRAAERICVENGLPARAARGTSTLPDWSYTRVLESLRGPLFAGVLWTSEIR